MTAWIFSRAREGVKPRGRYYFGVSDDGFDTPEEAARGDIHARYARALATAVAPDHSAAVVLLGTNEEPFLHPYTCVCYRENGRWYEACGDGGTGLGWTSVSWRGDVEDDLGVLHLSGEAPEGAVEAIVEYGGQKHRVPVTNGYYVFACWDVPSGGMNGLEPPAVRFDRLGG